MTRRSLLLWYVCPFCLVFQVECKGLQNSRKSSKESTTLVYYSKLPRRLQDLGAIFWQESRRGSGNFRVFWGFSEEAGDGWGGRGKISEKQGKFRQEDGGFSVGIGGMPVENWKRLGNGWGMVGAGFTGRVRRKTGGNGRSRGAEMVGTVQGQNWGIGAGSSAG